MTRSTLELIYFTDSYPFGLGEEWKRRELEVFREFFSSVDVIPLHFGGNSKPKPPIPGIRYHDPLFPEGPPRPARLECLARVLAHPARDVFLDELRRQSAHTSRHRFSHWLSTSHFMTALSANPALKAILKRARPETTVLYFFWARGISEILPLIDVSRFRRVAVRLHGYDLYADRGHASLPYQRAQLRRATDILPCSDFGAAYLRERYPELALRIRSARLGTEYVGRASASVDGTLRLVTCALVSPVKRLHLVVDALHHVSIPVHWTHIGDGDGFVALQKHAERLATKRNVRVSFLGRLDPRDVSRYYTEHPVDLFLNVSSSEGLPVSIMEAFSAGVPALATAVGGTPEIVDASCGGLLDPESSPAQIGRAITDFSELAEDARARLRDNAFERFSKLFDAHKNARAVASSLVA